MLGLKKWLAARAARRQMADEDLAWSENEDLIARYAPEVSGMGFVQGGAHLLNEIAAFKARNHELARLGYAQRLIETQEQWRAEGRVMPWWLGLTILRQYEADWNATASDDSISQP